MRKNIFKIILLIMFAFVFSSCGHMIGPMLYKKNDCGPYSNEEIKTKKFSNRSNDITLIENGDSKNCQVIKQFHCWDYTTYSLHEFDLKAIAKDVNGNAIQIDEKWEIADDFKKDIKYRHYRGQILSCK